MLRLYSDRAAERIIRRLDAPIRDLCARYGLPAPLLQAVLYREITQIDLFDPLADGLVTVNLWRMRRRDSFPKKRGLLYKCDSSTGYAQIFGRVGIEAVNFALDRGLTSAADLGLPEGRLDANRPRDRRLVWRRLRREPVFNLTLAALNLLSAAEEKTGRIDFASYGPEDLQRILTRYNGTSPAISAYGKAAYADYLRYAAKTEPPV